MAGAQFHSRFRSIIRSFTGYRSFYPPSKRVFHMGKVTAKSGKNGSGGAMPKREGGHKVAPDAAPGRNYEGSDGGAHAEVAAAARGIYQKAKKTLLTGGGGEPAMQER